MFTFALPVNGLPTLTRARTKAWSCTASRDQGLPALRHQAQLHQGQVERRIKRWGHEHIIEWCSGVSMSPEKMRQRRETVEHPFGTIKARMGATHFLMKTLQRSPPRWRYTFLPTISPGS